MILPVQLSLSIKNQSNNECIAPGLFWLRSKDVFMSTERTKHSNYSRITTVAPAYHNKETIIITN